MRRVLYVPKLISLAIVIALAILLVFLCHCKDPDKSIKANLLARTMFLCHEDRLGLGLCLSAGNKTRYNVPL